MRSITLVRRSNAVHDLRSTRLAEPRFAIPLAIALRQSLIDVAGSRQAQEGQQTKMELVYRYLTGAQFRHRIDTILENSTICATTSTASAR